MEHNSGGNNWWQKQFDKFEKNTIQRHFDRYTQH